MSGQVRVVGALTRRALNEILRVPGAAIPGVLAPTIFMVGLASIFGRADELPGFTTDDFMTFILPVGLLQGAGFTGAATGVNLARDIEQGWFDRLVVAPVPRPTLLSGIVLSASFRAMLPAAFLLAVGLALGVSWPGLVGLAVALPLVAGLACAGACWGTILALRFRTQQAAPLMQVATFTAVLFTTSYAPEPFLTDWMRTIAEINPVTKVLEGVRQGFVGDVTWTTTWEAYAALAGILLVLVLFALRGLWRTGER